MVEHNNHDVLFLDSYHYRMRGYHYRRSRLHYLDYIHGPLRCARPMT